MRLPLNRKVKDLKRLGRGYKNFEHFRNRFLYSTRSNPVLNGSLESSQVQNFDNDDFWENNYRTWKNPSPAKYFI